MCCSLLEVSGLSLCILNDFEVLPVESWPLRQAFLFTCTDDVLELEDGDTGEGKVLHIELCLLSGRKCRCWQIRQTSSWFIGGICGGGGFAEN